MLTSSAIAGSFSTALIASTATLGLPTFSLNDGAKVLAVGHPLKEKGSAIGAPVVREAAWFKQFAEDVRRLGLLSQGWDGPGSQPISNKSLFWAASHTQKALLDFKNVSAPQLVPGGDGSVQVEWHTKNGEIEFDIDTQGRPSIWIRDRRNGAEYDAEGSEALSLFYHWAPRIASRQRHVADEISATEIALLSVAA